MANDKDTNTQPRTNEMTVGQFAVFMGERRTDEMTVGQFAAFTRATEGHCS